MGSQSALQHLKLSLLIVSLLWTLIDCEECNDTVSNANYICLTCNVWDRYYSPSYRMSNGSWHEGHYYCDRFRTVLPRRNEPPHSLTRAIFDKLKQDSGNSTDLLYPDRLELTLKNGPTNYVALDLFPRNITSELESSFNTILELLAFLFADIVDNIEKQDYEFQFMKLTELANGSIDRRDLGEGALMSTVGG